MKWCCNNPKAVVSTKLSFLPNGNYLLYFQITIPEFLQSSFATAQRQNKLEAENSAGQYVSCSEKPLWPLTSLSKRETDILNAQA